MAMPSGAAHQIFFFIWLICKCSHLTLILTSWQRYYDVTCRMLPPATSCRWRHSLVVKTLLQSCICNTTWPKLEMPEMPNYGCWHAKSYDWKADELYAPLFVLVRLDIVAISKKDWQKEERNLSSSDLSDCRWLTDMHYGNDICYVITTPQARSQ